MVVSLCHTGGLVNWEVVDQLSPIYVECNQWKNCKFVLLKFSRSSYDKSHVIQFFFWNVGYLGNVPSVEASHLTLATGKILNICKHVCKDNTHMHARTCLCDLLNCKITMYYNAECFNYIHIFYCQHCPCRDLSFNKLNGTIPPSFDGMRGVDYM
jgi:hypothetical protein